VQVPNCDSAVVPSRKLSEYLLSETHGVGKAKAKLFRGFGFDESNVALLEQGLVSIVQTAAVVEIVRTSFGTKYVVDGPLETPRGDTISIRTVWIVEVEGERPVFVTAYPA
jgi:hypothetical protein